MFCIPRMAFSFIKIVHSSDTLTKREAVILKICPPAIITSAEVIIAEYDAILGQWEREDFYNHLSNYTNCFYFDALFLFTRETISFLISDCLSRYPAWSFLVWFKRRTTIRDGVSTLYAWIFRCFEARVAHILFRNHCVAFPLRCHFVLHFYVCAHALSERRGL